MSILVICGGAATLMGAVDMVVSLVCDTMENIMFALQRREIRKRRKHHYYFG